MTAAVTDDVELLDSPDDLDEFNSWAHGRGYGDGLPLVPPTPERVARMVAGAHRPAEHVLGIVAPDYRNASVLRVAVNAVMAGCQPTDMPILAAAVRAACRPEVNLIGLQGTTHSSGLMILVNGPGARAAGIHSGSGVFGPGFRANAAIGRAMRLVLWNIGGGRATLGTDRSTQGSPAKFSFCFAENEEASPWTPLRTDLGFGIDDTVVTVVGAEAPRNIDVHSSLGALALLRNIARSVADPGTNNAYIRNSDYYLGIGPEHARVLAAAGWDKPSIRQYVYENARIPFELWQQVGLAGVFPQPKFIEAAEAGYGVPMSDSASDIHIVVVGGEGQHSCFIPTVAIGRSATELVEAGSTGGRAE